MTFAARSAIEACRRGFLLTHHLQLFKLSRHATPYHIPLYLAHAKGYFKDEGIQVAILEPNDPSDVTEIIGSGKVDMGFKAMIHTLAVRSSLRCRHC